MAASSSGGRRLAAAGDATEVELPRTPLRQGLLAPAARVINDAAVRLRVTGKAIRIESVFARGVCCAIVCASALAEQPARRGADWGWIRTGGTGCDALQPQDGLRLAAACDAVSSAYPPSPSLSPNIPFLINQYQILTPQLPLPPLHSCVGDWPAENGSLQYVEMLRFQGCVVSHRWSAPPIGGSQRLTSSSSTPLPPFHSPHRHTGPVCTRAVQQCQPPAAQPAA